MVRYDSRKGSKYGRGGYGSRRDPKYAGRGSRYDRYDRYIINYDSITKIGVKLELFPREKK